MPWRIQSEPTTMERVIGGISYLTAGIAGLLYMLLTRTSHDQSMQFRFHTFQSIFLSVILVLFDWGVSFLTHLLLPLLSLGGTAVGGSVTWIFFSGLSILTKAFYLLFLYGAIMAFLGKFAEVPYISNIVRHNMRA